MNNINQRAANINQASPLPTETRVKLVLAWVFVGVPLCWGVYQTLLNAMKLFQ